MTDTNDTEYPDTAGYPDGKGTLDEGTAAHTDDITTEVSHELDTPSTDSDGAITVHRHDEEHRYVAELEGVEVATLRFSLDGTRTTLLSTTVQPEFRDRGIAADLIAYVLDDLSERGGTISVECSVVQSYLSTHHEYDALIDPEQPGLPAA